MCDTVVVVQRDRVLFAKNSDRDANEAQLLEWNPRRAHPAGATVRCTYLTIPQVRETCAVMLSRPFWMWGAEMGANEHGVAIGNEAVFTRRRPPKIGLTGMDLLRLGLERAESAAAAVDVLTDLLERHGQGGGCDHESRRLRYDNSFLVADGREAYVLETAGRSWRADRVEGARTISNALTLPGFAEANSDRLYTAVARGRVRQARTSARLQPGAGPLDLMALLRDHGPDGRGVAYRLLNGSLGTVCMHGGGLAASSVTTASWVSELRPGGARHWVTATAAPCCGLFKPVAVDDPLDLGPSPEGRDDGSSLWWRHERLHRSVVRDPEVLLPLFEAERDALEAAWLRDPPPPAAAFAEGDRRLAEWTRLVTSREVGDGRPWWARRYWAKRNRTASFGLC